MLIYIPVSEPQERILILNQIANSGASLQVKLTDDNDLRLTAEPYSTPDDAKDCLSAKGDLSALSDGQTLRVNFEFGDLVFYLLGTVSLTKDMVTFKYTDEIFKLQRRSSFRFEIPDSYPAVFSVIKSNDEEVSFEAKVLDFTETGLRLLVSADSPTLVNDVLQGSIKMSTHDAVKIGGIVRSKAQASNGFTLGLEFDHLLSDDAATLYNLVAVLREDVFFRAD